MKILLWILLLIILVLWNRTVEGASNKTPSGVQLIYKIPYPVSFQRMFSYDYQYKINPIDSTPFFLGNDTTKTFNYYLGIVPNGTSLGSNLKDKYFKQMRSAITTPNTIGIKQIFIASYVILPTTSIVKVLQSAKITDVALLMKMHDVFEKAVKTYNDLSTNNKRPIPFAIQVMSPIPKMDSTSKTTTTYIQAKVDYPPITM